MRSLEKRTLDDPIDDLFEALELLVTRDYRSGGYLCLRYKSHTLLKDRYKGPRIVREHVGGAYDMEVVAEDIYFVTERLANVLTLDGYTQGKPEWGGRDQYERHATPFAEKTYWQMVDDRRRAAAAAAKKET